MHRPQREAAVQAKPQTATDLLACFDRVRSCSESLCAPLAIEDYVVQPMADASPPKWHLAHTSWFFETFLLKPFLKGYQEFNPLFESLFNSYYNGVGRPFPRLQRGLLSRPTVAEVYEYRSHVNSAMHRLLGRDADLPGLSERVVLGLHHEQQHQELLLTDIKCNLGNNPLYPAYREDLAAAVDSALRPAVAEQFVAFSGGVVPIGFTGSPGAFCFDNELPRHEVLLAPFALATRPVTNGEYLQFMQAGGYSDPSLWLSDGWSHLQAERSRAPEREPAPLYWRGGGAQWQEYRLAGLLPLEPSAPVTHISFYEADAYARWRGHRLPTEQEWEHAAAGAALTGNFAESQRLHPQAAGPGDGLVQLFGDVWEWTLSAYGPYPGYRPLPGTLGEYNGKFMSNQRVLRGGSCATPGDHIRRSYRNFFYPPDRWQFTGIRLASDAC